MYGFKNQIRPIGLTGWTENQSLIQSSQSLKIDESKTSTEPVESIFVKK